MRLRWTVHLLAIVSGAVLAVNAQVQNSAHGKRVWQLSQAGGQSKIDNDIPVEEPEPSAPRECEARRSKNLRYNGGRADLTVERSPDSEIFIEQVWPAVDFIPASDSVLVAAGRVVKVQPYLSSDRSRIYTEITIEVDDLLKQDQDNRLSVAHTVAIDRLGGALKLKTGGVVRDDIQIDNLGKPSLGKRYIFFARGINGGNDISLIKSYELADGKVFTNDSRPSRLISTVPGVPKTWAAEQAFVEAVRREVRGEVGRLK